MNGITYRKPEELKDSGVEWLGEIPYGWKCYKIKTLSCNKANSFVDGDWIETPYIVDEGVRLIQTGNIGIGRYKEQGFKYISEVSFKTLNCKQIDVGDILICRLAFPVGRACLAPKLKSKMITSVDVCMLKPKETFNSSLIVYILSSNEYLSFVESICRGGTRDRISRSQLGNVKIPIPSLYEQQKISNFLDYKTSQFDSIIKKKELLIQKLEEAKKSLISEVVTGKVKIVDGKLVERDPSEMKDSGVEWLGMVPSDWNIKKLKNILVDGLKNGIFKKKDQFGSGVKLINVADLYSLNGIICSKNLASVKVNKSELRNYSVNLGDLFFVRSSLKVEGVGICSTIESVEESIVFECHVVKGTVKRTFCLYKLLLFYLNSITTRNRIISLAETVTMTTISQRKLLNLEVIVPPIYVQKELLEFIESKIVHLDRSKNIILKQIEKLKQAKQSLISEAVTGKIDLRDWEYNQNFKNQNFDLVTL